MLLEARNITFAYKGRKPVLHNVSLTLAEGKILYVLGHNGSGKTTLLSCLSGILRPTSGSVLLEGASVYDMNPARRARRIGLIPQIHVPVFAYTVRQMVLMGRAPHLGLFGKPDDDDYAVVDEALAQVGLESFRHRLYTELSGGERQLVMIARGLAQQCDFLLMDEPDAHLDPSNQHHILEVVANLAKRGLSFIIASHAPNSALMFADDVLLMRRGRVLASGNVNKTLTELLLTQAYGVETEVIYKSRNGRRAPRAILPKRVGAAQDVDVVSLKPTTLGNPQSPLGAIFEQGKSVPQVVLVTGGSGSGKSSWCSDLIIQAQRQELRVCGILSPAVVRQGRKIGIDLVDVSTAERRRLANLRHDTTGDMLTDLWKFNLTTLEWGNTLLSTMPRNCDLLVIDELGPLELKYGKGLTKAFSTIAEQRYGVVCIAVRPKLMEYALARWPDAYVVDVDDD